MLAIEMLPARQGDALLIEYGPVDQPYRVLVDGGTVGTREELRRHLSTQTGRVELEAIIVTHIDADHIGGILGFLTDKSLTFQVRDVWFNGWRHLPGSPLESLGPVQGERLTQRLLEGDLPWNGDYEHGSVAVPEAGELPVRVLPGGLKLTLLSPGPEQLYRLKPVWEKEVRAAGLVPGVPAAPDDENEEPVPAGLERLGPPTLPDVEALAATPFEPDLSEANGSSIALLAEFEGKRLLLGGDAHVGVLLSAFDRLVGEARPIVVDALKLPHHGSRHSVSKELIERVQCRYYLFSSNGSRHKHPDREAVSRVLLAKKGSPTLVFNYCTPHNELWGQRSLTESYGYSTLYPSPAREGIRIGL